MSAGTPIDEATRHSDLIPVIVGAAIGLFVTIATSFLKKIWEHLARPHLEVSFGKSAEYQTKTQTSAGPFAMYIRLRVVNKSPFSFIRPIARSCRATLAEIEIYSDQDRDYRPTIYVDNISLQWSCRIEEESWAVDIYPETPQYLDLLSFEIDAFGRGKLVPFEPRLKVTPLRYSNELFKEHGQFRFTVQITGENVKTVRSRVEFKWEGKSDTYSAW